MVKKRERSDNTRRRSRTCSVNAILRGAGLFVRIVRDQVGSARVQPTRAFVEVEVDRYTQLHAGAVVLTCLRSRVQVVLDAVDRVLTGKRRPLRCTRCQKRYALLYNHINVSRYFCSLP